MKMYIEITQPKDPEFKDRYVKGKCLCIYQEDICVEKIITIAKSTEIFNFGRSLDDLSQEWDYKIITKEEYEEFKLECL